MEYKIHFLNTNINDTKGESMLLNHSYHFLSFQALATAPFFASRAHLHPGVLLSVIKKTSEILLTSSLSPLFFVKAHPTSKSTHSDYKLLSKTWLDRWIFPRNYSSFAPSINKGLRAMRIRAQHTKACATEKCQKCIEVERKFVLSNIAETLPRIEADMQQNSTFVDSYYDDDAYSLTCADLWLRRRNGIWQLKIPALLSVEEKEHPPLFGTGGGQIKLKQDEKEKKENVDIYEEIISPEKIKEALGFQGSETLEKILEQKGIIPFATIATQRISMKKVFRDKVFGIDLDVADFGYAVGEVELLVNDIDEIEMAERDIARFMKEYQLESESVSSKLVEYLRLRKPSHYVALLNSNLKSRKMR